MSDHANPDPQARRRASLARIQKLAYWLDDAFRVPVIGKRVGIDGLIGMVPVAGDLFDMADKANRRNQALMQRWLAQVTEESKSSRGVRSVAILLGVVAVPVVFIGLWRAVFGCLGRVRPVCARSRPGRMPGTRAESHKKRPPWMCTFRHASFDSHRAR